MKFGKKNRDAINMEGHVLTKADIIDTTGVENIEDLEDLEILFLATSEIGGLHECSSLRRFAMIDNGILRISGLRPLGYTLLSLTLCDQRISKMENLELPNLRELFLHRNQITTINGLHGCQRLKKLWLMQNKITHISCLHFVPELEECWLQSNQITSLQGIEHCKALTNLSIAGNPISDFSELTVLKGLPKLVELCLTDVHFGRTPITDHDGYKEYVICHLQSVQILDGVLITPNGRLQATNKLDEANKEYQLALERIEDDFRSELQSLNSKQKSKESHCSVLEREMGDALRELQTLLQHTRSSVTNSMEKQRKLINNSVSHIKKEIDALTSVAKSRFEAIMKETAADFDLQEATFELLERLLSAEGQTIQALGGSTVSLPTAIIGDYSLHENYSNGDNNSRRIKGHVIYTSVSENAPDFLWFADMLTGRVLNNNNGGSSSSGSSIGLTTSNLQSSASLVKLFRLGVPPPINNVHSSTNTNNNGNGRGEFDWSAETGGRRVFTVTTPDKLTQLLQNKWTPYGIEIDDYNTDNNDGSIKKNKSINGSIVLCSHASTALQLYSAMGDSFESADEAFPFDDGVEAITALEDAAAIFNQFESYQQRLDETLGNINNSGSSSPTKSKKNKAASSTSTIPVGFPRLQSSKQCSVMLVVCSRLDTRPCRDEIEANRGRNNLETINNNINDGNNDSDINNISTTGIAISSKKSVRKQMLHNLSSSKKAVQIPIIGGYSDEHLYTLPSSLCNSCCWIEFVAVVVSPVPEGVIASSGGNLLRLLESRVEAMTTPAHTVSPKEKSHQSATKVLAEYEYKARGLVREYIDQILEEVQPEEAKWLQKAQVNVDARESELKGMRNDIDGERRAHESMLRDLKAQYQVGGMTNVPSSSDLLPRRKGNK